MVDFRAIIDEIPQPLWGSWYIKDKIESGVHSEVYKIEAVKSERIDYSSLKIQPIVIDNNEITYSEEQEKALLEEMRQEIVKENKVMHNLIKCPYIAGYLDEDILPLSCMNGYVLLIRTEYLMELPALMQKGGFNPTEDNILRLASDIGRGLNAAHKLGIHHRDIKPSNFFAAPDGTFRLGDFNISGSKELLRTASGTAGYIAPEIYNSINTRDVEYTDKADIYSFGMCLYQLMNDFFFPFEEECSTEQAVERRMNGELFKLPKNASVDFGRIIFRACAYDPAMRYNNMDEMLRDLENLRACRSAGIPDSMRTFPENNTVYADAPESSGSGNFQPVPVRKLPENNTVYADSADPSDKLDIRSIPLEPELEFHKSHFKREKKRKSSRRILLLLIFVVIAIIIFLLTRKDDDDDNNRNRKSGSAYSLGDVDGDGVITESDASLLLKEYTLISAEKSSFSEKQIKAADINGDGFVNGVDATLLLGYCTYKSEMDSDEKAMTLKKWLKEKQ